MSDPIYISSNVKLPGSNCASTIRLEKGALSALINPKGESYAKRIFSLLHQESSFKLSSLTSLSGLSDSIIGRPSDIETKELPPVIWLDWQEQAARDTVASFSDLSSAILDLILTNGIELCAKCDAPFKRVPFSSLAKSIIKTIEDKKFEVFALSIKLPSSALSVRELRAAGIVAAIAGDRFFEIDDLETPPTYGVLDLGNSATIKSRLSPIIAMGARLKTDNFALHRINRDENFAEQIAAFSPVGTCAQCLAPSALQIPNLLSLKLHKNKDFISCPELLNLKLCALKEHHYILAAPSLLQLLTTPAQNLIEQLRLTSIATTNHSLKKIMVLAETLIELGLGYLPLSFPFHLLSTGELCKLYLARELAFPINHLLYCIENPEMKEEESKHLFGLLNSLRPNNTVLVAATKSVGSAHSTSLGNSSIPEEIVASSSRRSLKLTVSGVSTGFLDADVELYPKTIGVVCGSVGSGKSRLLRQLAAVFKDKNNIAHFETFHSVQEIFSVAPSKNLSLIQYLEIAKPLGKILSETDVARLHGIKEKQISSALSYPDELRADLLLIKFKNKNAAAYLESSLSELSSLLRALPKCRERIELAMRLGLSDLKLGSLLSTLGSGELQKLALLKGLSARKDGTLYLIDDLARYYLDIEETWTLLLEAVQLGATVLATTNNAQIIKAADYRIELEGYGFPRRTAVTNYSSPR